MVSEFIIQNMQRVLVEFAKKGESPLMSGQEDSPVLTPRQEEVLNLVAQGFSNKEIARNLHISYPTVKFHVSQILERLQLRSRHELAHYAQKQGLLDIDN